MKQTLLVFLFVFGLSVAASAQVSLRSSSSQVLDRVELRVYPNPVVDHFEISESDQINHIRVYNLVGRKMKDYTYTKEERYYVGDLPRGLYLVQLIGNNNKTLITRRINKE